MKTKLILLFLLVNNIAFAQIEEKQNHTFSVNVNYLLDQWISKSDRQSIFEVESDHIILVMYRYKNFRIGAGGVFRQENVTDVFSASAIWNQTNRGYVLQVGTQGITNIWKKWDLIYGGDILIQHRKFRSELLDSRNFNGTGDAIWTEIKSNSIGLNGFMGVQFYVTKQLSLSTEFSLRLNRTYNDSEFENNSFISNPLSNVISLDRREGINLDAPLTLFLNFQF